MKVRVEFESLARRLTQHAAALATAHVTSRRLARQQDERRWRQAGLLWPLFGKG